VASAWLAEVRDMVYNDLMDSNFNTEVIETYLSDVTYGDAILGHSIDKDGKDSFLNQDIKGSYYEMDFRDKPVGMFDFVKLQKNAYCILSDSGTIHEEAAILETPVLVIRESTERPEALDAGNVILTGVNVDTILTAIDIVRQQYEENILFQKPIDYQNVTVSDKVVRLIVGMSRLIPKKKYLDFPIG